MFWTLDLITFNKISPLSDKESYLLSSQYRSLNKKEQALLESARVYLRRIKCVYAVSEDYATRRGRFQEKRKKNFWDNDVSDVNLSLKLWPVFLLLWDLRWNPRPLTCVFMWRRAGGEIQAGRRQRRRGVEKQSEESRQRTAAHRHHQETVGLRVSAGNKTHAP